MSPFKYYIDISDPPKSDGGQKELLTGQTIKSIDVGLVFIIILLRIHSMANDCP